MIRWPQEGSGVKYTSGVAPQVLYSYYGTYVSSQEY
jgi:hypothetical protein